MDQRVWSWDQAMYGLTTLRLWNARLDGVETWMEAMIHATPTNPPLLVWIGQFLVPMQKFIGELESTLLLVNILAAGATLTLLYLTARRFGPGLVAALAAVLICAGSQIFIELNNQYMLEAMQCCAAASMMFAAWRVEQRSWMRIFSLLSLTTAFSFLTKASSVTFVLPLLTYGIIALIIMRRRVKPALRFTDVMLLLAAVMLTGAALKWYTANWESLVAHFITATVSDETLYWGSPLHFPTKIAFWTSSLATALSPFVAFAICLCILVAAALAITLTLSYDKKLSLWAEALVENGGLFALALTGTVIATLLTFSLQINEDRRFLLPLIPLISVLVGWSLSVARHRAITVSILCALGLNAIVTRVYAHGGNPLYLLPEHFAGTPYFWTTRVHPELHDKLLLIEAIRSSCRRETGQQSVFVAVDYDNLNINSANFYSEKERTITGLRCQYENYGSFQTDVQHALNVINRARSGYVLTVAPDKQPSVNAINVVSKPVAEHLAQDPQYELAWSVNDYILIYRRVRAEN
jgi:hypothetical protein